MLPNTGNDENPTMLNPVSVPANSNDPTTTLETERIDIGSKENSVAFHDTFASGSRVEQPNQSQLRVASSSASSPPDSNISSPVITGADKPPLIFSISVTAIPSSKDGGVTRLTTSTGNALPSEENSVTSDTTDDEERLLYRVNRLIPLFKIEIMGLSSMYVMLATMWILGIVNFVLQVILVATFSTAENSIFGIYTPLYEVIFALEGILRSLAMLGLAFLVIAFPQRVFLHAYFSQLGYPYWNQLLVVLILFFLVINPCFTVFETILFWSTFYKRDDLLDVATGGNQTTSTDLGVLSLLFPLSHATLEYTAIMTAVGLAVTILYFGGVYHFQYRSALQSEEQDEQMTQALLDPTKKVKKKTESLYEQQLKEYYGIDENDDDKEQQELDYERKYKKRTRAEKRARKGDKMGSPSSPAGLTSDTSTIAVPSEQLHKSIIKDSDENNDVDDDDTEETYSLVDDEDINDEENIPFTNNRFGRSRKRSASSTTDGLNSPLSNQVTTFDIEIAAITAKSSLTKFYIRSRNAIVKCYLAYRKLTGGFPIVFQLTILVYVVLYICFVAAFDMFPSAVPMISFITIIRVCSLNASTLTAFNTTLYNETLNQGAISNVTVNLMVESVIETDELGPCSPSQSNFICFKRALSLLVLVFLELVLFYHVGRLEWKTNLYLRGTTYTKTRREILGFHFSRSIGRFCWGIIFIGGILSASVNPIDLYLVETGTFQYNPVTNVANVKIFIDPLFQVGVGVALSRSMVKESYDGNLNIEVGKSKEVLMIQESNMRELTDDFLPGTVGFGSFFSMLDIWIMMIAFAYLPADSNGFIGWFRGHHSSGENEGSAKTKKDSLGRNERDGIDVEGSVQRKMKEEHLLQTLRRDEYLILVERERDVQKLLEIREREEQRRRGQYMRNVIMKSHQQHSSGEFSNKNSSSSPKKTANTQSNEQEAKISSPPPNRAHNDQKSKLRQQQELLMKQVRDSIQMSVKKTSSSTLQPRVKQESTEMAAVDVAGNLHHSSRIISPIMRQLEANVLVLQTEILLFHCMHLSYVLANKKLDHVTQTKVPLTLEEKLKLIEMPPTYQLVEHIIDAETDTHCMVFSAPDRLIIAFRGSVSLTNWQTDFNSAEIICEYANGIIPDLSDIPTGQLSRARTMVSKPSLVHRGFVRAYESVRERIKHVISPLVAENRVIFLTGHSLGGGLAIICAMDLSKVFHLPTNRLSLTTWGCPKVGTFSFVKRFNRVCPSAKRFVMADDIIAKLPIDPIAKNLTFNGWWHCGTEILLNEIGNLLIRPSPLERFMFRKTLGSAQAHLRMSYCSALIIWIVRSHPQFEPNWSVGVVTLFLKNANKRLKAIPKNLKQRVLDSLMKAGVTYKFGNRLVRDMMCDTADFSKFSATRKEKDKHRTTASTDLKNEAKQRFDVIVEEKEENLDRPEAAVFSKTKQQNFSEAFIEEQENRSIPNETFPGDPTKQQPLSIDVLLEEEEGKKGNDELYVIDDEETGLLRTPKNMKDLPKVEPNMTQQLMTNISNKTVQEEEEASDILQDLLLALRAKNSETFSTKFQKLYELHESNSIFPQKMEQLISHGDDEEPGLKETISALKEEIHQKRKQDALNSSLSANDEQ